MILWKKYTYINPTLSELLKYKNAVMSNISPNLIERILSDNLEVIIRNGSDFIKSRNYFTDILEYQELTEKNIKMLLTDIGLSFNYPILKRAIFNQTFTEELVRKYWPHVLSNNEVGFMAMYQRIPRDLIEDFIKNRKEGGGLSRVYNSTHYTLRSGSND